MPMDIYHRIYATLSLKGVWFCFIYLLLLSGLLLCFFVPLTIHQEYFGYWEENTFFFYVPLEKVSTVQQGEAFLSNRKCGNIQISYDTVLTGILKVATTCPFEEDVSQISIHYGKYTLFEILIQKWKGEI